MGIETFDFDFGLGPSPICGGVLGVLGGGFA